MLALFAVPSLAVCAVTFDKTIYFHGEGIGATMSCDNDNEKSKAYTLTWRNQTSGDVLQTDTGTTPALTGNNFFNDYVTPDSGSSGEYFINATLTGTNLEGVASANITVARTTDLVIKNLTTTNQSQIYLGWHLDLSATIESSDGNLISGADCHFTVTDVLGNPLDDSDHIAVEGYTNGHFEPTEAGGYTTPADYTVTLRCYCGVATTSASCIDSNGDEVSAASGSGQQSFTISNTESKEGGEGMLVIGLALIAMLCAFVGLKVEEEVLGYLFFIVSLLFVVADVAMMALQATLTGTTAILYAAVSVAVGLLIFVIAYYMLKIVADTAQTIKTK